jgi:hypothetical protein
MMNIGAFLGRAWRGEPLVDEAKWWRIWRRFLWAGVILLAIELAQTLLIRSPALLVDALYHGRQRNHLVVDAMKPADREKFLYRLCRVNDYYRSPPDSDMYSDACAAQGAAAGQ